MPGWRLAGWARSQIQGASDALDSGFRARKWIFPIVLGVLEGLQASGRAVESQGEPESGLELVGELPRALDISREPRRALGSTGEPLKLS